MKVLRVEGALRKGLHAAGGCQGEGHVLFDVGAEWKGLQGEVTELRNF